MISAHLACDIMMFQSLLSYVLLGIALKGGWSVMGDNSRAYKAVLNTIDECDDSSPKVWKELILKKRKSKSLIKGILELKEELAHPLNIVLKIFTTNMGHKSKFMELTTEACEQLQLAPGDQHFVVKALLEGSDLPKQCPFPKGVYTFHNVTFDIKGRTSASFNNGNYIASASMFGSDPYNPVQCLEANVDFLYI